MLITGTVPGDTPDEPLYDPAAQTVQGPPAGPLEPLLHVQAITAPLPSGELEYDGQLAHVLAEVAPEIEEYVPPGQREQDAEPASSHVHVQASARAHICDHKEKVNSLFRYRN